MSRVSPVELFDAASRLPPGERTAFLDAQCDGDPELRAEVESLLTHLDAASGFMTRGLFDRPIIEPRLALAGMLTPGTRIASYRIERVLGEGGMGIVYTAEQDNPSRKVALKVIRPGAGGRSMLRRFQREAQLLGRLQHPGIAQIFEAGVARMGEPGEPGSIELPFLAMELIEGPSLSRHIAEQGLSTRGKLELMVKVCDAVEHAHQRGLIHRDLKPGNILVTPAGQPKVLDFGVAKALDHGPNVTMATEAGQLMGTVAYMSPEQVDGDPAHLDIRSDVYTLGVILYELLAGRLPHDVRSRTVLEAAREIREAEPKRLSTLERTLRGDVETIALRALEKDRDRRYQSAAALGEDLRRYLAGEPIMARQDSALYVLNKRLRRYRWAVGAAVVFLLLVAMFGAWAAVQAKAFRSLAASEAAAKTAAQASESRVKEQLRVSDIERGRLLATRGDLRGAERALWAARLRRPDAADTGWALRELFARFPCLGEYRGDDEDVYTVRFSPDGSKLVLGGDSGHISIWDVATGAQLCTLTDHTKRLNRVRFSPDGALMASCGLDSVIRLWNTRDWSPAGELHGHWGSTSDIAFGRDGLRLYSTGQDATVKLWDLPTRSLIREDGDRTNGCWMLALDESRGRIVTGNQAGIIQVRDAATLELLHQFTAHPGVVHAVAMSPDRRTLVSCGREGTVALWNAADWSLIRRSEPNVRHALGVSFSPDGTRLAVTGTWTTVVLDPTTLEPVEPGLPEIKGGWSADFSPDGGLLATTASDPGEALVWPARDWLPVRLVQAHKRDVRTLAQTSDGTLVGSGSSDGSYAIWESTTGREVRRWTTSVPVRSVAFTPDGRWFISAHLNGSIRAVPTSGTEPTILRFRGHRGGVEAVECLPDGRLVSGGLDGTVRVWDWSTLKQIVSLAAGDRVGWLATSPDGRWIAASAGERTGIVWDARTFEQIFAGVERSPPQTSGLTFSPDSRRLLITSYVGGVDLLDPFSGSVAALTGHTRYVARGAFAPDSRTALTVGQDDLFNIWDVPTARCLASLPTGGNKVLSMVWRADACRAVTGSGGGVLGFWDLGKLDDRVARFLSAAAALELSQALTDTRPQSDSGSTQSPGR